MNKMAFPMLAILTVIGSSSANAGQMDPATVSVAQDTIVFSAASAVTHSLTGFKNLTAGQVPANTQLADGTISLSNGQKGIVALRFTSDIGNNTYFASLHNAAGDELIVSYVADTSTDPDWQWYDTDAVLRTKNLVNTVTYKIFSDKGRPQEVQPGSYNLSMTAGVWQD